MFLSVNVSICFVCCVFVNCLVKQFAMFLGVVAILLLNVMDVFSVCGGALLDSLCMVFQRVCVVVLCWIDNVWSSKESVCCACDPNERLSAPSIYFVCVFICRKLSPHLRV